MSNFYTYKSIPQWVLEKAATSFWEKVERDSGCWNWTAAIKPNGYGTMSVRTGNGNRIQLSAHKWAYLIEVGPVPDGFVLDHLCRNRKCVRVSHLQVVTQSTNLRRGISFNGSKICCKSGHSLENAKVRRDGGRTCRECHRLDSRKRYQRNKENGA